jgi:hypothetical protein
LFLILDIESGIGHEPPIKNAARKGRVLLSYTI